MGEIKNLKPVYDEVYGTLDYGPILTARGYLGVMDMLPRMSGKDWNVLCVGSGNSYEAVWLTLNDKKTFTLDYHHPKVKTLNGKQVYGQGQAIPFNDETFKLVFSAECLEHIPENEVDQFLSELYRVGNCQYYFTIAERNDPPYHTHVTIKGIEWWMEKLESLGYRVINADWRPCVRNVSIINSNIIVWDSLTTHGYVFYAAKH